MQKTSGLAEQVVEITTAVELPDLCANVWVLVDDESGWFWFCPIHEQSIALGERCCMTRLDVGQHVSLAQPTAVTLIHADCAKSLEMRRPDGSACETSYGRADGDWPYHQFAEAAKWPGREIHREITDWLYSLC